MLHSGSVRSGADVGDEVRSMSQFIPKVFCNVDGSPALANQVIELVSCTEGLSLFFNRGVMGMGKYGCDGQEVSANLWFNV